jgi:hypothetical protein
MSAGDFFVASAGARAEEQDLGSSSESYGVVPSAGAKVTSTTRHVIYTTP